MQTFFAAVHLLGLSFTHSHLTTGQVLDMGGNAVAAYREDFDLEGGSGMVARGIGTAIRLEASSVSGKPR